MQNPNTIEFRQIRDFGDVLNVTFQFLRQNFSKLGKSLLLWVAPFVVAAMLFNVLIQLRFFPLDPAKLQEGTETGELLLLYLGMLVFSLCGISMAFGVVYGFMALYERHGTADFELDEVWQRARSTFFPMLGTLLSIVLLMTMVYSFLIIALSIFGGIVGGGVLTGFLVIVAVFGGILVAVYFAITFALMFPIMINEPIGLIGGMQRCFYLVKNQWWATFGVLFIAWLISSILGGVFSIPMLIILFTNNLHAGQANIIVQLMMVVFGILGGLASALFYGIPLVATGLQYFNLVECKDRAGLMQRVDSVTKKPEEFSVDEE